MSIETQDNVIFSDVQALMADIFDVEIADISSDTQFGDLPKWDSMGHMDLMVALESKYAIAISADSIRDLVTISAILDSIRGKQDG